MKIIDNGRELAIQLHGEQKYGDQPYIVHLDAVVGVLKRFGFDDPNLIQAAYLHDASEDQGVTSLDLRRYGYSNRVIDIVERVTDEPGKNRKERKAKTYPKIAASRDATIIKLADRIANVESGGKLDMYRKEYREFCDKLYNSDNTLHPMWDHLKKLMALPNGLTDEQVNNLQFHINEYHTDYLPSGQYGFVTLVFRSEDARTWWVWIETDTNPIRRTKVYIKPNWASSNSPGILEISENSPGGYFDYCIFDESLQ